MRALGLLPLALFATLACRPAGSPSAPEATPSPDAQALCEEILDVEETPLLRCGFSASATLEGGAQVNVLELQYDDAGHAEIAQAYLVVRLGEDVATELLGEAYDVPGQVDEYSVGKLKTKGDSVRVEAKLVTTIYPNTGDPDADPEEEVEEMRVAVTCKIEDEFIECERDDDAP